jgi:hypothetical protein
MMRWAIVASLIAYSLVVSQPLFYLVALGRAQRQLSAAAYIELRQRINPVMTKRLPMIYLSALATGLLVLGLAWRARDWTRVAAASIALVCLILDVVFMMRENVPINGAMDRWSVTNYPADWESYRTKWFEIFAYREVLLLIGFFALLVGAVSQT